MRSMRLWTGCLLALIAAPLAAQGRPASDGRELDAVSQPTLIYPYWHQNWSVYDRMSSADLAFHKGYPR